MRRGAAFWLTGLPGSGKTTLALSAVKRFPSFVRLSMDEMRRIVTPAPTYSEQERDLVYRSLVYAALVLTREGKDVVIDATANLLVWRELARSLIPNFHEIYVQCPLELCRKREGARADTSAPKGIYKKAESGWPVPGVNVPYEEPERPELVVDTGVQCLDDAEDAVIRYIEKTLKAS